MTTLWEGVGTGLATRLGAIQDSALMFWVWALVVWCLHHGGWSYVTTKVTPLFADASAAQLLALALAAVVVLTVSSLLVTRLTRPVLRALEGYRWPAGLRAARTAVWKGKLAALQTRQDTHPDDAALQARLRRFPADPDVMPTRIGNILSAGERRPAYAYGLDPVVVWPQLCLVLPEQPRTDLAQARTDLDRTTGAVIWAAASSLLGVLWLPAALIGLLAALLVWRVWIPHAAEAYARVLSAVFDTHRFHLYDALHYPRPTTPTDEKEDGEKVTRILWAGGLPGDLPPAFTTDTDDDEHDGQPTGRPPTT